VFGQGAADFNWACHAYYLMTNHCHMVIETPDSNLSKDMWQLHGVSTQYSNRHHLRAGHLFQCRFKAILVDGYSYFLELARYALLNRALAGMVGRPGEWSQSSYRAKVGQTPSRPWLTTDGLLATFRR